MARIHAPNREYDGISAGVKFEKGIGETANPHLIHWFASHGYHVILDAAELNLPIPEPIIEPEKVTVKKAPKRKRVDPDA